MLAPMLCLLLAAPAPKNTTPEVEIVVRILAAPDVVTTNCGLDERLEEGAAILSERELVRLYEEVQNHQESTLLQMPRAHRRTGEVLSVKIESTNYSVEPRSTKGKKVTLQLRREVAKGAARISHEADLVVGETLLVRKGKKLIAVSVQGVSR